MTRMPLPLPAIRKVTKFLQPDPHPTAMLIKALAFIREDAQDSDTDEEYGEHQNRIYAGLRVTGPGVRQKDLSTPWPHTFVTRHKYTPYNPRWAAWDMIYSMWFSYDERTGERNLWPDDEDVDSDDEDLVSNSFVNSLSPWG